MINYPNEYSVEARRDDLMRRANQERLANQVQPGTRLPFRRAVELLVGAISSLDTTPRQRPAQVEPVVQPSKLATDSGIYRIR